VSPRKQRTTIIVSQILGPTLQFAAPQERAWILLSAQIRISEVYR
jgi:hypothetical protein